MKQLLFNCCNVFHFNRNGDSILHFISKIGITNLDIVKELVDYGANVDLKNKDGFTPLQIAVLQEEVEIVRELLNLGAKINTRNSKNETVIHLVANNGNVTILKELLTCKDVELDLRCDSTLAPAPIHTAIINGYREIVELLLHSGANVNLKPRSHHRSRCIHRSLH